MNTDAEGERFLHKELTREIIGAAMDVLNELGHGFHEKPYENALCVEFRLRNLPYNQQASYPILYKNYKFGEYIPDLIVDEKVVVDTKTIEKITPHEEGQMLNYLRITGLQVGLVVNFMHPRLEWKRIAL